MQPREREQSNGQRAAVTALVIAWNCSAIAAGTLPLVMAVDEQEDSNTILFPLVVGSWSPPIMDIGRGRRAPEEDEISSFAPRLGCHVGRTVMALTTGGRASLILAPTFCDCWQTDGQR